MRKQPKTNSKANNLLQRLTKDFPKKHIPVRAIKSDIASQYWRDGFSFIRISDVVFNTDLIADVDIRGKMTVNLMMSLECSLKSLIISLSKDNETPLEVLKLVKNKSHDNNKLYDEVVDRSKKRFKISERSKIFDDINNVWGVWIRYGVELYHLKYEDQKKWISKINDMNIGDDEFPVPIEDGLIERTIDNPEWYHLLRNQAVIFNDLAYQCHQKYLDKHRKLYGERLEAYSNEKDKFYKEKQKRRQ